jgi:hypothetical protein
MATSCPKVFRILIETKDGKAAAYSPDLGLSVAGVSETEALGIINGEIVERMKSGSSLPVASSPLALAREFPGVLIKMLAIQ